MQQQPLFNVGRSPVGLDDALPNPIDPAGRPAPFPAPVVQHLPRRVGSWRGASRQNAGWLFFRTLNVAAPGAAC